MKTKVGILMGGYSPEASISVQSGETVYANLSREEFDVYKVIISRSSWLVSNEDGEWPLNQLDYTFNKGGTTINFDVIFNAVHGHPGEDGYLQASLELKGIPHSTCGFFESALTFNKRRTNELLAAKGITVADAAIVHRDEHVDISAINKRFNYPIFIKPNKSGSSFGVSKVNDEFEVMAALELAFKQDENALIEEAIIGTEVGCGVVKRNGQIEAIAITEIVPKKAFFDYEAKYNGASEEITPARISDELYDEICKLSEGVYQYLDLWGVIRIDYIIQENVPYLIEVNGIPGLSPASIVPQQLAHRNWDLAEFFGGLLKESIAKTR